MALEFIPNQPFIFTDRNETQDCKNSDSPCVLLQDGDNIYVQALLTPCEEGSILCDSDFGGEEGDAVANGNFLTSAAGWTLGATWSYNAGGWVVVTGAGSTSLSQVIADTINEGNCYTVFFRVLNYVSGSITPSLSSVLGTSVNADGSYMQVITAGAANEVLAFIPTAGASLSITDIQLFDMGACWCPDNGNIYHTDTSVESAMCHIPGLDTILTQVGVTPPIINGERYKVQITITGSSAGSVHVIVGAAAVSVDFVGNGDFTDYVTADADDAFAIFFSSDFDGCVTQVIVEEMASDIDFGVVEIDGSSVQELNGFAQYIDDRVIFTFNTSDFNFTHGCYKFFINEPCEGLFFYSNCFNWQSVHAGTRQIIAIDREASDPTLRYSYGFLWFGTSFYLVQRVFLHFRKPSYDTRSVHDRFSTGRHFRSYAEKSKKWELAIEGLSEDQHDCMNVMWGCLLIDIDGTYYFTRDEEYVPLWDDVGHKIKADVKINVTRRDDVIFSDNCNR